MSYLNFAVRIIRAIRRLERELDAATRLSQVRVIAQELRRAREALPKLAAEVVEETEDPQSQ